VTSDAYVQTLQTVLLSHVNKLCLLKMAVISCFSQQFY
jgi:hypothetical protein